jgi:RNA polymerase sigma factor (sigma-70 family)
MSDVATISAELIFQHRAWLLTVVRSRVRCDHAAAEDLFGTWLVEILAKPTPLNSVGKLEPWLYRVFVNRATDWIRGHQRQQSQYRKLQDDPAWSQRLDTRQLPPLDCLLQDEQNQQVSLALEQLPDEDLEILKLKYLHDWTYERLVDQLGLSHDQVVYRLRQARLRLKAILLKSEYWTELAPRVERQIVVPQ